MSKKKAPPVVIPLTLGAILLDLDSDRYDDCPGREGRISDELAKMLGGGTMRELRREATALTVAITLAKAADAAALVASAAGRAAVAARYAQPGGRDEQEALVISEYRTAFAAGTYTTHIAYAVANAVRHSLAVEVIQRYLAGEGYSRS